MNKDKNRTSVGDKVTAMPLAVKATAMASARPPVEVRVPQPPNRGPRPPALPIRVMCVDDHAVLVEGLKAHFAVHGDIQVVARLGTAARLVEEVERHNPHVVLLDIEMPGPDVFEMANRLHQAHPQVRIILLSAHVRDAFVTASFSAGVCAYFAKSDELADIVKGIENAVKTRTPAFTLSPKVLERCRPVSVGNRSKHAGTDEVGFPPITLMDTLTTREQQILRMIGQGQSRTQIATQLSRSAKTVDAHQHRMMKKLGIAARADLLRFAIREGFAQV